MIANGVELIPEVVWILVNEAMKEERKQVEDGADAGGKDRIRGTTSS